MMLLYTFINSVPSVAKTSNYSGRTLALLNYPEAIHCLFWRCLLALSLSAELIKKCVVPIGHLDTKTLETSRASDEIMLTLC